MINGKQMSGVATASAVAEGNKSSGRPAVNDQIDKVPGAGPSPENVAEGDAPLDEEDQDVADILRFPNNRHRQ